MVKEKKMVKENGKRSDHSTVLGAFRMHMRHLVRDGDQVSTRRDPAPDSKRS